MASKRLIVLDRQVNAETYSGNQADQQYAIAFWLDVPASRQSFYASASKTSQWKNAAAADITAIQNGAVSEVVEIVRVPWSATTAQIQTALQNRWTQLQNGVTSYNPWNRYGTTWDGTSWVAGGVA